MTTEKQTKLVESLKQTVSHLKREIFASELKRKPLVFSFENAKIKDAYTFSLPSGWTCPGATMCLAKVGRESGKLTDGPDATVRCFSASQEAVYPTVRAIRWHNFDRLKQAGGSAGLAGLILESLPADAKRVRVHVSGDFFSQAYFNAWMIVAEAKPEVTFYAYTKSVPFWVSRLGNIPANFKLNASVGSRWDALAQDAELKSAKIVFSEMEAENLGLEIDHDDSHAWAQEDSFALLVHGVQKTGTEASVSWNKQLREIKKTNAALPKKIKRTVLPPTVAYLTAQIVRLSVRLAGILATPEYVVKFIA